MNFIFFITSMIVFIAILYFHIRIKKCEELIENYFVLCAKYNRNQYKKYITEKEDIFNENYVLKDDAIEWFYKKLSLKLPYIVFSFKKIVIGNYMSANLINKLEKGL